MSLITQKDKVILNNLGKSIERMGVQANKAMIAFSEFCKQWRKGIKDKRILKRIKRRGK